MAAGRPNEQWVTNEFDEIGERLAGMVVRKPVSGFGMWSP
jgi:hypothetical protein